MDNKKVLSRISRIMQVEATVPSRRDFLLTHVPFRNLSLGDSEPITEERLFEEKLLAEPEKHKTIMILGENGSGKSHLIRWLYERYIKEYGTDNEVEKILWISKAHNTLQDALMQLLKSNVFPEEIRKNELEKVRNAQSAISGLELKKTINFNFTLVIEDDIDKKVKSTAIDPGSRSMLPSYLRNEYILSKFLMRENGPLDRICSKLNNVDNAKANDFEGEVFTEADFAITMDDLKNHLEGGMNSADKYTILLAKKLMNNSMGKARKSIASYMNSKVDEVIQRSLKLTTSDFKQLFWSLRTKLKEMGMRLTLFVEDINAFTGIDLALMDVLVANHESEGNEDYCRLASVVGTTNDFYKNRLNDSLRDRVKDVGAEVYIREESLFGTNERLTEFAAKYINASMLTDEEVETWEREYDCDNAELPVANVAYKFARVNCQDKELSIFPFNERAIVNLYEKLDSFSKTPRRFLLDVVYPVLRIYYSSPEDFLDNESAFKNDSITSLNDFANSDYQIINDKVGGPDTEKRSLLLRIWGNATTEVVGDTLGGLDKEVFDAFGVDMRLDDFKGFTSESGEDPKPNPPKPNPPKPNPPKPNPPEPPVPQTYLKIRAEIGEWSKNSEVKLNYASEIRTLLRQFIYGNMEWDVEEIPYSIVEAYINTNKYISIEGQNSNIREDGIIIKRNSESEYLFYALLGYKYLGKNSWRFEQGLEYYNLAMIWLVKHHDEIISLVKAPYETSVSYREMLLVSLVCAKLVCGGIKKTNTSEEALLDLFSDSLEYSSVHGAKWQSLYEEISKIEDLNNYKDNVLSFFSNVIGTAEVGGTKYTFVDAYRIIKILEKLISSDWDLTRYIIQGTKKADLWYKAPKIVALFFSSMRNVVVDEISNAEAYKSYFKRKIPGYLEINEVEETFSKVRKYLFYIVKKRNLNYEQNQVKLLSDLSSAQYFVTEMKALNSAIEKASDFDKFNTLALNPFEHVKEIYGELNYFDKLVIEKNNIFKKNINPLLNTQLEEQRKNILYSLNNLIKIGQEVTS